MDDRNAPALHRPEADKRSSEGAMAGRRTHDGRKPNRVREASAGSSRGAVTKIPPPAHEGLMRAWLDILKERHPEVTWIAREPEADDDAVDVTPKSEISA